MAEERLSEAMLRALRMVAPGTVLYEGLENVLRARTGALIVVGDTPEVLALVDGGFRIDAELNPSALYELCKMDGAIILSSDARRILLANVQLQPDPMLPTQETGTRHRTAERVARQTGQLVIAISQRRNVITLYQGNWRYLLPEVSVLLTKANQALSTLEKYKAVLEQALTELSALEFEGLVTLQDVVTVIQRAQMVDRIVREIQRYVVELGSEGRLVDLQMEETLNGLENEGLLTVKDYRASDEAPPAEQIWKTLEGWPSEQVVDPVQVARALGYGPAVPNLDQPVTPRGYRLLNKIPRLPVPVIDNLVRTFSHLPAVLTATVEELDAVDGIGEVRAKSIKDGLRRLRDQAVLDRRL
ncbi:MAG TPA: DNA integrity scanning protein DisA [Firmicutes bacterium]|nr:DNA integrity scanning protein DisA [Bacillota bacterium]